MNHQVSSSNITLHPTAVFVVAVVAGTTLAGTALAEDTDRSWRQFRGNTANGLALKADLPTQWSEDTATWVVPIPGRGWSSPVVEGGEVWLTTATEDGLSMSVMCIDLDSGKVLVDKEVFTNAQTQADYHTTNSYASPTPVLGTDHVFVHFGAYGTAAINRSGHSIVWQRRDLLCNHYRGPGSSPILHDGLLIFHMDGFDYQYAIALDASTGKTVWKKDRDIDYGTDNGDFYKAFSTPIVIEIGGQSQLISPASKACLALDPKTGDEIWRVRYDEHSTTVRPLFDGQYLYLSTGFGKAKMLCVAADGKGDVTDTHVKWVQPQKIGSKPSPVLVDGRLFNVWDKGILVRLDTETGKIESQLRLSGDYSASLIATEDYIYAFDMQGSGHVLTLADEPEKVAENKLPAGCNASPAVAGNSLIVRTTTHLYRFDK